MARLLHRAQGMGMKTSIDVVSESGDRFAKSVFDKSGEMLGKGLSLVIDIVNPAKNVVDALMSVELPAGVELEYKFD